MVLAVVQDSAPAFASHIAALSGVSGGSLGVAVFAALAHDAGRRIDALGCAADAAAGETVLPGGYSKCVRKFMRDDHLSPVLAKMLAPDFAQRFFPIPVAAADRSQAIEGSWELSYRKATGYSTLDSGLVDFETALRADSLAPLMLLNSTHVETGTRYIASVARTDSILTDTRDVVSLLEADIPLATAAHNSARFAYVSPAGHLDPHDGYEYGHVVDGGYFENSGLVTLREVYDLVRARDTTRSVVVIYLCNNPLACDVKSMHESVADSIARTSPSWASEILAPPLAILNTRDARGALAEAEMRSTRGVQMFQLNVCAQIAGDTTQAAPNAKKARDRVVSPPLGWSLSQLVRDWMDRSLRIHPDSSNSGPAHETTGISWSA
jgi:hypothetical protein